jgi:hypothetical protein
MTTCFSIVILFLIILISSSTIATAKNARCLEGGVGRKRVDIVNTNGNNEKNNEFKNTYMEIHNSLEYDDCPDGSCRCCSYYYNVSETSNQNSNNNNALQEYCVSWTSATEKSCTEETPNAVPGSYKLKTTSCNPEVNDACNNCFEGSKPKTSGVTGNYSIIMTYGIIIFTIIFRI